MMSAVSPAEVKALMEMMKQTLEDFGTNNELVILLLVEENCSAKNSVNNDMLVVKRKP